MIEINPFDPLTVVSIAVLNPATIAVALLPSPRAGGTASCTRASSPTGSWPSSRQTLCAAR